MKKRSDLSEYKQKFGSDPADVHALIGGLKIVIDTYNNATGRNVDWIYRGFLENLGPKARTRIEAWNLGLFAALLIGNGANINQLSKAMGDWDGTSMSSIKRGYYRVRDEYGLKPDASCLQNHEFVQDTLFVIHLLEDKAKKPFPRHKQYEETYQAFHKAKKFTEEKIQNALNLKMQIGLAVLEREERRKKKA